MHKTYRLAAAMLLVALLGQLMLPMAAMAITSGPTQPDFTGFEPLGTTGMVNEFTGAFTYNIPLLEVPGPSGSSYPVTMAYHSGAAIEEDASWVGFGWSLSPGAINRNARGLPDDYKGAPVTSINRQERNETFAIGPVVNLQVASFDLFTFQAANRYNTFSGFSVTSGFSLKVANVISLNLESTNGISRFSANISWANVFSEILMSKAQVKTNEAASNTKAGYLKSKNTASKEASSVGNNRTVYSRVASFIVANGAPFSTPMSTMSFTGGSITVRFALTVGFMPGPVLGGINAGMLGSYSWQQPKEYDHDSAYGYLYQGEATWSSSRLTDKSFEREGTFTNRERYLFAGYSTPDDFQVTGQGIGGSMRLVHNRPGYAGPQSKTSTMIRGTIGFEPGVGPDKLTAGAAVTLGADVTSIKNATNVHLEWGADLAHQKYSADGNARAFMRFLNDPADNVRYVKSDGAASVRSSNERPPEIYSNYNDSTDTLYRPRSSACISYRLNHELSVTRKSTANSPRFFSHSPMVSTEQHIVRSDTAIADGIGELSVVNGNGIRYVYGLPVYNRNERQLSFSRSDVARMEKGPLGAAFWATSLYANWRGVTRGSNVAGTVKLTPYASSFLLTAIQTPDYVDRTMDGPTADDFGGYTRFEYQRAAGTLLKSSSPGQLWYKWRTPYRGYAWEEENLTNSYDDRASVSMGEREMYYMSKIDTKTHTAFFITNKTTQQLTVGGVAMSFNGSGKDRHDGFESFNTGDMDADEAVSGSELWKRSYPCGLDRDSAIRPDFKDMICGGRTDEKITQGFINSNSMVNKSQVLEKIVLLAKDENGNYTHIVKTVNLEYSYETMASWPTRSVNNLRWDERKRINVPETDVKKWDTIYHISGTLNSRHYHSKQNMLTVHSTMRNSVGQYGKLTLKRIWTDYGLVKNSSISPYEFVYRYRDSKVEPVASEIGPSTSFDSLWNYENKFVDVLTSDDAKRDSINTEIQNPPYNPMYVDSWGSYRRDWPNSRALRRSFHDQTYLPDTSSRFDPAAWQLKRIMLPSGGQINVHYEQNTYAYVQDRPVEALVPLLSYQEDSQGALIAVDLNSLPGRSPQDLFTAMKKHVEGNRMYFKLLFPLLGCGVNINTEDFPRRNSEFISGFASVSLESVVPDVMTIRIKGSPRPKELLKEFVMNQNLSEIMCADSLLSKPITDGIKGEIGKSREYYGRLASKGGDIASWGNSVSSWVMSTACMPYMRHSFVRIPCLWKTGGGVRVKRIFMYDPGIEQGRAGVYGREYIYERSEPLRNGDRVLSSGVATNEPAGMREESALHRFLVGRDEQSWDQRLAAGEDLEQFTAPLCPSAMPAPSIGYSRVVTRSIAQGSTSPGFIVSDFYSARDFPVIEAASRLQSDRIVTPPILNPFVSVSINLVNAGQGFSVITNQMHGRVRSIRQCAGSYNSSPNAWNVVASEEHEYYAPGEKIPVLTAGSVGALNIVNREMGTNAEVLTSSRMVSNDHVSLSGNFDIGISLLFIPVVSAAISSSMLSTQRVSLYTTTKLISYACFEKRTIFRRDGMVRVQENGAFDEATGQPVVTISYDDYDGAQVSAGQVHAGAILQMSYPAWRTYPQMGSAMTNENTRHGLSPVVPASMLSMLMLSSSSASYFSPGDLIALVPTMAASSASPAAYARVTSVAGATVNYYVLSGTPSSSHKVAVIIRSGRTNQLTAASSTLAKYGSRSIISTDPFTSSTTRVLSASATTWSDNLGYDSTEYMAIYGGRFKTDVTGDYERGMRGKWRPKESYVFRSETESIILGAKPREAGRVSSGSFSMFPHTNPSSRDTAKWVLTSRVLAYTPDGDVAIEHDAIGIPTTARFAHKGTVPSIIAKNTDHAGALFESFEDRASATSNFSHTGGRSWAATTGMDSIGVINISNRTKNDGLVARAWVKAVTISNCIVKIGAASLGSPTKIADVGGWKLLEWSVAANAAAISTLGVLTVSLQKTGTADIFVDDLRLQPASSSATCYVYDASTLRLVAQFDDQHFAALFKYTPDGRLTRKDRETEQGVLPLQEQHANSIAVKYSRRGFIGTSDYQAQSIAKPRGAGGNSPVDYDVPFDMPSEPTSIKAQGEIFDLKLSPDRRRVKFFGDSVDLRKIDSITLRANKNMDTKGSVN